MIKKLLWHGAKSLFVRNGTPVSGQNNQTGKRIKTIRRRIGSLLRFVAFKNRRIVDTLIDKAWYKERYREILPLGLRPRDHYFRTGAAEACDPNLFFDTDWYLSNNPDVVSAGMNPLDHFARFGIAENRDPSPLFCTSKYVEKYMSLGIGNRNPLAHFLAFGFQSGWDASAANGILQKMKVAVIIHLYYKDLWEEIVAYLANMPVTYDLYVTIPEENGRELEKIVRMFSPTAIIITVKDFGSDIGPFVQVLPKVIDGNYLAACKLHTKKGTSYPAAWRRLMLHNLLGSRILIARILYEFETNEDLEILGPRDLYLSASQWMTDNQANIEYLKALIYPKIDFPGDWGFFAGSMFWFRPRIMSEFSALKDILDGFLTSASKRNDKNMDHALERLFGMSVAAKKGMVGLVDYLHPRQRGPLLNFVRAPGRPSKESIVKRLRGIDKALLERTNEKRTVAEVYRKSLTRKWRPSKRQNLGVNFIGPVGFINGLSTSARGYVSSLLHASIPTNVVSWKDGFERVREIEVEYPKGEMQPINLVHLNLDLLHSANWLHRKPLKTILANNRYNVCIPYWELRSIIPEWFAAIQRFDEIWCASSFMFRSIKAITARHVRIVHPGLSFITMKQTSDRDRKSFGLPNDAFVFFYAADSGSVLGRKNPGAFVDAYVREFKISDGACCLVKLHYSEMENKEVSGIFEISKRRPDVILMRDIFSERDIHRLFQLIDCYVSPHRSEGLGLTVIEAMSAGKPVIATPYGGVTDFVSRDTAFTIDYDLIEVGENNAPYPAGYIWADPDVKSIQGHMRHVFENPEHAKHVAGKGANHVRNMFSIENTSIAIRKELERIWRNGEEPPVWE